MGTLIPAPESAAVRAALSPLPGRRLVIVVDDEEMLLELDLKMLAPENYDVVSATSGIAALELLATLDRVPDLLITDFLMPGMNGRELAARLREVHPDLKVLFQTGYTDRLFGSRELLEPGTAFLEKPFTQRGLREAARLVLFGRIDPAGAAD
ncbi:MAG: response regulator [Acidobacteriota bacterium]|nr:response regulator [Acidobacteriota bacterium]